MARRLRRLELKGRGLSIHSITYSLLRLAARHDTLRPEVYLHLAVFESVVPSAPPQDGRAMSCVEMPHVGLAWVVAPLARLSPARVEDQAIHQIGW